MADQNSQFMAMLTAVGEARLANATALGVPWNITQLGVGDGNGAEPTPSRAQTALINERRRAPLNQLSIDPNNSAVVIAEQVIPEDVGGWWIREIGLYDEAGDLVAVANCPPTFKPELAQGSGRTQLVRLNILVSSTQSISLKIDPSVVLATREFVITTVSAELAKLDTKQSVKAATTTNLAALSGLLTVDGVALTAGARVLVKDQTTASQNGIYIVAAGAWARAADADLSSEVTPGLLVTVESGSENADTVWQLTSAGPIALGTTALIFTLTAAPTASELDVDTGTNNTRRVTSLRLRQALSKSRQIGQFGYIAGLTLSNNAAAPTTDIDIAPGGARSADNSASLLLDATITKRLQSAGAWTPGVGGNGLFAGARVAQTWYHVFLIRKDFDGTVEAGFDTSISAANRPAGYTAFRRIGSVKTDAGNNILPFVQHGRRFYWVAPVTDVAIPSLAAGTSATYVITTPPGLRTVAMLQYNTQGGNALAYIRCPDLVDITPSNANYLGYGALSNASPEGGGGYIEVLTNISSQIGVTVNNSALITLHINALGWIDQ